MKAQTSKIDASQLNKLIENREKPQLVDVREHSEFNATYIKDAVHVPFSQLSKRAEMIDKDRPAYLICQSGFRAARAAEQLSTRGFSQIVVLEGGLGAWQQAGFKVETGSSKVWSMERQVRFAAGLLVAVGIVLSWAIHPYFIGISLFVGAGLVYSALTNTCNMAMILGKLPWNQAPHRDGS